jgi:hypothetical protein
MYSGFESLNHYADGMINSLGRGTFARNYGNYESRKPYEKMKVPEGVYFKKINGGESNCWGID